MKKILLILVLTIFAGIGSYAQGYWTQKADFGGTERCSGIGMATTTKGYVFCGYKGGVDHFKDTWEYDPIANTWTQKADFPGVKRRWLMGFVLNAKCYVGMGAFMQPDGNYIYYTDFYEYNPATDTWAQKASFPGSPRAASFCFNSNNMGYVGGGSGVNGALDDLWKYNPNTDTWTQRNNITCGARWACAYFSIGANAAGRTVYVGLGTNGTTYFKDLWEYNIGSDSWSQKANLPGVARWYAGYFSIGNYGYMGSGNDGYSYLQDFYQYDRSTDSWTQIPDLTGVGRCEAFSFFINDRGFIGSGLTDQFAYTPDFWEYTPSWYGIDNTMQPNMLINIYPNPATDYISIETKETGVTAFIYSMHGQLLIQKTLGQTNQIDVSKLATGVYALKLVTAKNESVKRFIKE